MNSPAVLTVLTYCLLDTPKMVAAMDLFTIVARDRAGVCFRLLTFARERHKCEFTGVARKETDNVFLFRAGKVGVRFIFLPGDQVKVEPVGTGYRKGCDSSGDVQPAIYTRR